MANGVPGAPADGGQGSTDTGVLDPQIPGGPTGQDTGQDGEPAATIDPKAHDELRTKFTQTSQENAKLRTALGQLQRQMRELQAGAPGTKPAALADLKLPDGLNELLGEDMVAALGKSIEQFYGAREKSFSDKYDSLEHQGEVDRFYQQFPDMRQHMQEIELFEENLNAGQVSPIQVIALAVRALHMPQLIQGALTAERTKWEGTERKKILASMGPGASITPGEGATPSEEKAAEGTKFFGVKKPKYTHQPRGA